MSNQQSNKQPLAQFKLTVELTCEVSELSDDQIHELYGHLSDKNAQAVWEAQRQMLRALLAEPDTLKIYAQRAMLVELLGSGGTTLEQLLGELPEGEWLTSEKTLLPALLKYMPSGVAAWWRTIIEADVLGENLEAFDACFQARVVRAQVIATPVESENEPHA